MKTYWIVVVIIYSVLAHFSSVEFSPVLYGLFALCFLIILAGKNMYLLRITCYVMFMCHWTNLFGEFDEDHVYKMTLIEKHGELKKYSPSQLSIIDGIGVYKNENDGGEGSIVLFFKNSSEEKKEKDNAFWIGGRNLLLRLLIIGFGFLCLLLEYFIAGGNTEKAYQAVTEKCPYCFKKISRFATKCPYCTHDLPAVK